MNIESFRSMFSLANRRRVSKPAAEKDIPIDCDLAKHKDFPGSVVTMHGRAGEQGVETARQGALVAQLVGTQAGYDSHAEVAMIRRLILLKLASEEKTLGESLDYARHILRVSLGAFLKFMMIMPLTQHRRVLPPGPYHVARLVATRDEDCGTCVQIEVNLAKKAGLDPKTIRAVLDRHPDELADELADAYRFADAVVTASGEEGPPRERIRARYGEKGLVELALAIAACRVFPIAKRALGYAQSCSAVPVRV
jgi:alkylhydroperoxidase family enzyme